MLYLVFEPSPSLSLASDNIEVGNKVKDCEKTIQVSFSDVDLNVPKNSAVSNVELLPILIPLYRCLQVKD